MCRLSRRIVDERATFFHRVYFLSSRLLFPSRRQRRLFEVQARDFDQFIQLDVLFSMPGRDASTRTRSDLMSTLSVPETVQSGQHMRDRVYGRGMHVL